jgi:predicted RNA-binding Zn-ribbon protein involved in translation (DUF1610 family)
MYEICTVCNRSFYSRDYPPRLCPICEEEAIRRGESGFFLTARKGQAAGTENRL